ncbi:MAG: geranylgeranylglycerol-phosphate geranylgeranyltransferase [Ignavibacteriaceae bacterium]|nr:geranylgeranylglycerol-phosphate geranylgeranyltransferase [Ignavibacteriaceae bacterium]
MKKLSSYIILIRPLNFLITFLTVIVAAVICYKGDISLLKVLLAALTASLTLSAGNIINDIFDIKGDKINHPERPLPSGIISVNSALIYYFILTVISISLSLFISNLNLIINLLAVLLLLLYSFSIKKYILWGNILVAFLTGLVFIYGGISVNNFTHSLIPAFFAFLINLIREIVKDMEDSEGDFAVGLTTIYSEFGLEGVRKIILVLSLLLILLSVVPYVLGIYSRYYFIVILVMFIPLMIYFLVSIGFDVSKKNLNKLSIILKLDMVFGLIALYVGK